MASKSSHHKESNTFRFQSFNERISQIHIDIRKIKQTSADDQEIETEFGEGVIKWADLNCTQDYVDFTKEVFSLSRSFSLLVHHQVAIIEILERHLVKPNSLAVETILDLIVKASRDLQGDFYPYFPRIFNAIVTVLKKRHHDPDILEQAFVCLAFLFKVLWRHMVKDIKHVYSLFSPLLEEKEKAYIRTFATESFSFLMRKVKDHMSLFAFIFQTLVDNPHQTNGVGLLLFEMMKGVQHSFHSNTNKVMPLILSCLGPHTLSEEPIPSLPWQEIGQALVAMCQPMVAFTSPEHGHVITNHIINHLDTLSSLHTSKKENAELAEHIVRTVVLLSLWLKQRKGVLLPASPQLCQILLKLVKAGPLGGAADIEILNFLTDLLMTHSSSMRPQDRVALASQVYDGSYQVQDVLDFTERLHSLPVFENDILKLLLAYCQKNISGQERDSILKALSKLVLEKSPLPNSGLTFNEWTPYNLPSDKFDFLLRRRNGKLLHDHLTNCVKEYCEMDKTDQTTLMRLWCAITVLPHMGSENSGFLFDLRKALNQLLLQEGDTTDHLFVCCFTGVTYILLGDLKYDCFKAIPLETMMSLLRDRGSSGHVLWLADIYFTCARARKDQHNILTAKVAEQVFNYVKSHLSSPHSQVRLNCIHLMCQFEHELPKPLEPTEDQSRQQNVFELCLKAEQVPVTLHDYRDKLMHMRKLRFDVLHNHIPVGKVYTQVALRYIIGTLYINLSLLWKPVMEILQTHGEGMERNAFWEIFGDHLTQCAERTEKDFTADIEDDSAVLTYDMDNETYSDKKTQLEGRTDKPDHQNFRRLMWQAMHLFPVQCEPKSRHLVPLVFKFLENEYYKVYVNQAPIQDISPKTKSVDDPDETVDLDQSELQNGESLSPMKTRSSKGNKDSKENENETIDVEEDLHLMNEVKDKSNKKMDKSKWEGDSKKTRKNLNKTLCVHLNLFAKFKNPRSLYKEGQLRELYNQLLHHKDAEIQKAAFNCIMTYNYKYLTPYRENFERLLDDKTFKNEIVLFSISEESNCINDDHREGLLPILMRILYGKMHRKTGKDSAGKGQSAFRKGVVVRFLAGCKQHEVKVFIDLVLQIFTSFISENFPGMSCIWKCGFNASPLCVMPLGRQHGLLETIQVMLDKLKPLMSAYIPDILQVLLYIVAASNGLLNRRDEVAGWSIPRLRNLRTLSLMSINKVFAKFSDYAFSTADLDAICEAAVWPQLGRLAQEGLYHPTPLLRLFYNWAQHSSYLHLLTKTTTDQSGLTPLVPVYSLLVAPSVAPSVVDVILNITEELLDQADNEEISSEERQLASSLFLPHVPVIMKYISNIIENLVKAKGNKKSLPTRQLTLLSRISAYVDSATDTKNLVSLLLSLLAESTSVSQDLAAQTLQTVTSLLKQVEHPEQLIGTITRLFWSLHGRAARSALVGLIQAVGSRDEEVCQYSELIAKLNAWDRRSVEEPDYNLRLDAFKILTRMVNNHEATLDSSLLCLLVHNCCYFISHVEDMSIRDCSAVCLSSIIDRLSRTEFDKDLFVAVISKSLLSHIKAELKHKSEICRHEYINLLAQLASKFSLHPVLADLVKLTNKEDVEVDFFENIKHVQVHRRARALRRLAKQVQACDLKTEVVMSYLLPITSVFLFDEAYAKNSNLQDAAVEAMGGLCSVLPWKPYSRILQIYINQLTRSIQKHKLMVRVVTSILDAFHFDLELSDDINPNNLKDDKVPHSDETVTEEETMETCEEDGEVTMETENAETDHDKTKCSPQLATRIHRQILRTFLPQLHKSLTQKAKSDDEHKKAFGSKYAEDEEILRVPLALAMIRLLQALPISTLNNTLPSVLLKVCQFLRSRAQDIRATARDTLIKISCSLGPSYFSYILKELRSALTRGYQLHVLSFTVNAVLKNMKTAINPGDLDTCVESLVQIFNDEIFGKVSEEKNVEGITSKLMEAKSTKGFESYEMLATYLTPTSLPKLLLPIKDILSTTRSHQQVKRAQDALKRVSHGLLSHKQLALPTLMVFTHGLTTEALPMLEVKKKDKKVEKKNEKPHLLEQPVDILKVAAEPKRGGARSSSSAATNMHILIEFGLELLYLLLKRDQLSASNMEHIQMLDPFVDVLIQCLSSRHVKVITISLRCLTWVIKMPLPCLKTSIQRMCDQLFVLLGNYASHSGARGDNLDLVIAGFKTVTVLVRDVQHHSINSGQLQVLLTYVEEDLHHHNRQATAFTLLKAILSRKLSVAELPEVIKKVQQLSITADSTHVRLQCRQVVLQYILDYPLGKHLVKYLEFYLSQLDYEYENGRESALEMLATIFHSFPQKLIVLHAGLFFLPMAARLVNDESAKCRKLVALAIKSLLVKLDANKRDELLSVAVLWFRNDKLSLKKLASILVGVFVEVEGMKFERHLRTILPDICDTMSWGISNEMENSEVEEDHLLFHLLNTVIKILRECGIVRGDEHNEDMNNLWDTVESCLLHGHTWVRLSASQLYGLLFASVTTDDLLKKNKNAQCLTSPSPIAKMRQLSESFCTQLQTPNLHPQLADQVIKNLIFVAKSVWALTDASVDLDTPAEGERSISLPWLIRKLCREAKHEAAQNQKASLKRSSVFKWMAAVSQEIGADHLPALLPLILPPLVRAINDHTPTADEGLKSLANQVTELMKTVVGIETFSQIYSKVQQLASKKEKSTDCDLR